MSRTLCPVLAVPDPAAALDWFARVAGLPVDPAQGHVLCGPARIVVTATGAGPAGLRAEPFDHLALRVADVDATLAGLLSRGARLHPGFTPDGPREIAEFWQTGVRFAFVIGPGGAPLEFCARRGGGPAPAGILGLDHLGLRSPDAEAAAARLVASGARPLARHRLAGPVEVRFLAEEGLVWEVFDEAAAPDAAATARWAGIAAA